jgi:hypothetical protein
MLRFNTRDVKPKLYSVAVLSALALLCFVPLLRAEETLRLPLVAPSVFDGLVLPPKNKELAELTPSKSQAFLAALGAARAAMEEQA